MVDQIATIRPDGSDLTLLTEETGYNEAPDYSPDGESLIYAHSDVHQDDPGFVGTGLWLMNSDGSEKHPLRLADGGGDDTEAEYSPDGAQIVFVRYRHDADDTRALHIAAADGSDVRRLTPWQHIVEHPRWSPDGRTIIYNIENNDDAPSNKGEGIWTVPAAGGKPVLLLGLDRRAARFQARLLTRRQSRRLRLRPRPPHGRRHLRHERRRNRSKADL